MACNVVTGYTVNPVPTPDSNCVSVSPGKTILFSPTTIQGTKFSDHFVVGAGDVIIIDAYNMMDGYHIWVNRLVMSSYCRQQGCNCDGDAMANALGRDGAISFSERMTLGNDVNGWSLYRSADPQQYSRLQLIINVPGIYNLELEDPDAMLMPGTLEVEYLRCKASDMMTLPAQYLAGIVPTVLVAQDEI